MLSAVNEVDLYNQLKQANLELVDCNKLGKSFVSGFSLQKVTTRDLIQMFVHLDQLQSAGVPLLESLEDLRNSADNDKLRNIIADMYKNVAEGLSLSEAMARHPKVFTNIYISLVAAGEETGDLSTSFKEIVKYAKWTDELTRNIKKAVRYPIIVTVFVFIALIIMMRWVVPQVVGFLQSMDQELPMVTVALIATSDFVVNYFWQIIITPIALTIIVKIMLKKSQSFAFAFDVMVLNLPFFGPVTRKINIARFAQTFGVLFTAGIDVLRCLTAGRNTVTNLAIQQSLENVETQVRDGKTLSQGLDMSGEFPSLVVRMVRIGEESGRMREVLDQVSEFYNNDVNESIQGMIAMIEPMLTLVMGGMIIWIAAAIFGPIYSNLANMPV
jgi:type IV pilus assembly protein PilC